MIFNTRIKLSNRNNLMLYFINNSPPTSPAGGLPPSLRVAILYTYLFEISRIQITLIAFPLNLILNGYLSRKSVYIAQNLITSFGFYSLLIELDECLIFFHITYNRLLYSTFINEVIRFDHLGCVLSTEVFSLKIRFFFKTLN